MFRIKLILLWLFISNMLLGQDYTSYFTGNPSDSMAVPSGGICLMGGATENDSAMVWFLKRAGGGDVLVLRASGSNGYNHYMYSQLGIRLNSVETIVCNNATASYNPYVIDKIGRAEAIWFAGGDQWDYVSYWRNTPVDSTINRLIADKDIAIGGTSAGMAIIGKYYFTAQNGTVTSSTALNNPYHVKVTIDSASFIKISILDDVITDTHFDNPDRKGRTVTFMARALTDHGFPLRAIACDEYTAVCIDPEGIAHVYGDYPGNDDNAYFIQPNCELSDFTPETCISGTPLTWNYSGDAVKVYKVKGTMEGTNTFSLNDWSTGLGGGWENWAVNSGILSEKPANQIMCPTHGFKETAPENSPELHPNPFTSDIFLSNIAEVNSLLITDLSGRILFSRDIRATEIQLNIGWLSPGLYILCLSAGSRVQFRKIIKN